MLSLFLTWGLKISHANINAIEIIRLESDSLLNTSTLPQTKLPEKPVCAAPLCVD